MKGFRCDRCETWYVDGEGARLQIRDGSSPDKDHPTIMDICNHCVASFQHWQQDRSDPGLVLSKKKDQP